MTEATPQIGDAQINAARTKLLIDKKLGRPSVPRIRAIAQLKTSTERGLLAS